MIGRVIALFLTLIGIVLMISACADDDEDSCAASVEVCGRDLSELSGPGVMAPYVPVYDELVVEYSKEVYCRTSVRGVCADGKRFVSYSGGFGSDTYYFDGDELVGSAWTTDVGGCGRCPFSGFYGTLANVRCDTPQWEVLCGERLWYGDEPYLPFADGESPESCTDCRD